jgi:predicted RecA/RadA family phage recombinase
MKNYVQPGNAIRLIAPTGGVIAGRPYAIGGIVGIASETEIAGGSFELARDGVYSVDKDASEFAAGDAVYALSGAATSDAGGKFLGYAISAAETGDETVDVLLVTGKAGGGVPAQHAIRMSQVGTAAPTATEIINTVPSIGNPVYSRGTTGRYLITYSGLAAAGILAENVVVPATISYGESGFIYKITFSASVSGDDIAITVRTYKAADSTPTTFSPADDVLIALPITVEIAD